MCLFYEWFDTFFLINKGVLIVIKGKKMKNLYTLIRKIDIGRVMKVEPFHKGSFVGVNEVVKVEECEKMMMTLFLAKSTHWHKNESNCRRNEVIRKIKTIF